MLSVWGPGLRSSLLRRTTGNRPCSEDPEKEALNALEGDRANPAPETRAELGLSPGPLRSAVRVPLKRAKRNRLIRCLADRLSEAELCEEFLLSRSQLRRILRPRSPGVRASATKELTAASAPTISTVETRPCELCGGELRIVRGKPGRPRESHDRCRRVRSFIEAAKAEMMRCVVTPEGDEQLRFVRSSLFAFLNTFPGIRRHSLRGKDGRFVRRNTR